MSKPVCRTCQANCGGQQDEDCATQAEILRNIQMAAEERAKHPRGIHPKVLQIRSRVSPAVDAVSLLGRHDGVADRTVFEILDESFE